MTRSPADPGTAHWPHVTWTLVATFHFGGNTTVVICEWKTELSSWAEEVWVTDTHLSQMLTNAKEPLGPCPARLCSLMKMCSGSERTGCSGCARPCPDRGPQVEGQLWGMRFGQKAPQGA